MYFPIWCVLNTDLESELGRLSCFSHPLALASPSDISEHSPSNRVSNPQVPAAETPSRPRPNKSKTNHLFSVDIQSSQVYISCRLGMSHNFYIPSFCSMAYGSEMPWPSVLSNTCESSSAICAYRVISLHVLGPWQ